MRQRKKVQAMSLFTVIELTGYNATIPLPILYGVLAGDKRRRPVGFITTQPELRRLLNDDDWTEIEVDDRCWFYVVS